MTTMIPTNAPTRYEMIAERDGERRLIGYFVRATRGVLITETHRHAAALLDGRKTAPLTLAGSGRQIKIEVNGWTIRWSGRTQRSALAEGTLQRLSA